MGELTASLRKQVAQTIVSFLFGLCLVSSVFGQGSEEVEGPPLSPSQQSEMEELKQKVQQLEKDLKVLKEREEAPEAAPKVPPPSPPLSAGTTREVSEIARDRAMLRQDSYAAAQVDNAPFDPTLNGFWSIPGTHSMVRFGGFARTDLIHDFSPMGDKYEFFTHTIPTTPTPGNDNTAITARASRLSLEFRTNTSFGVLRTYYENDFVQGNGTGFRLRHFYGQLRNFLVGQTWTTFQDADAIPDTVDFAGPNSWIYGLVPQARYTHAFGRMDNLAVAVENPTSDVPTTSGVSGQTIQPTTPLPDFTLRYRHETNDYHIQTAAVFRSIGGFLGSHDEDQVFGYGLMASGLFRVQGNDNFMFQGVYGEGISRYFNDTVGLGLDAGITSTRAVKAQPGYGGFAAYQHFWNDHWRSTATYGWLQINTTDLSPANTYKRTQYSEVNIMYSPVSKFTVGAGFLWGQRVDKDNASGDVFRLNFVMQYELVALQQDIKKVLPF